MADSKPATPDEKAAAAEAQKAAAAEAQKAAAVPQPTAAVSITDFAGTPGGPFAVYGEGLNQGAQVRINGQVPEVRVVRSNVIKGRLIGPGFNVPAGPVVVEIGNTTFKGTL